MIRPRKAVEQIPQYHPPKEGRAGKLRLDFNESTTGCAPEVVRALRRSLSREWISVYPEYEVSRKTLAAHFGVRPSEMLMTNGVDDAIKLICDTFVDPGDELAVPTPTFSMYEFFQGVAGGKTVTVPYTSDLQMPVERILKAINRRTRWVAIANPNNPTGTLIPKEELRRLLRSAPEAAILVDEAYYDFCGESILPWIRRYPNLIVARTFSKAFGLAGLRLGFLFANAKLAALLRRAHAVFPVNVIALGCALEAIKHEGYVTRYAAAVKANREKFCRRLIEWGIAFAPSAANFVFVRAGKGAGEVARGLGKQGILVRTWGHDPQLQGYLRISIGTDAQMRRLTKALDPLQGLFERGDGHDAWRDLITHRSTGMPA